MPEYRIPVLPNPFDDTVFLRGDNEWTAVWPVGSIYLSVLSTNPATYFGGTWTAISAGRVLVGVDDTQTEFDTAEETGGAKTHVLSESEMPTHTHVQDPHQHGFTTLRGGGTGAQSTAFSGIATGVDNSSTPTAMQTNAVAAVNQATGGGLAHNNLQPYLTCYIWKRVS